MKLRQWQQRALDNVMIQFEIGNRSVALASAVGTGKSAVAEAVAKQSFERGLIDFVVILAPQRTVIEQFKERFEGALARRMDGLHGSIGCVSTYANTSYIYNVLIPILRSPDNRTLLVLDEVHHLKGRKASSASAWAQAVLAIESLTDYTLSMSGTLYRTDKRAITTIQYDGNNAVLVYDYRLSQGIRERYNKSPEIYAYDFAPPHQLQSLIDNKVSYSTILDSSAVYLRLLSDADELLHTNRQHVKDAAGLVVCRNIKHAKRVFRDLQKLHKGDVQLITSLSKNDHDIIGEFRRGNKKWVVAVDKISEGVDIPRLQVVVYLTNKKTPMYFTQVFGRALRINYKYFDKPQIASLFCLNHPELIENAKELNASVKTYTLVKAQEPISNNVQKNLPNISSASNISEKIERSTNKKVEFELEPRKTEVEFIPKNRAKLAFEQRFSTYVYQLSSAKIDVNLQHPNF